MKTKCTIITAILLLAAFCVEGQINLNDGRVSQNKPFIKVVQPAISTSIAPLKFVSDRDVPAKDNVIADDQIIQGSLGVGFDCVNGENFGFNTILLKENNLRIKFDDTSLTPGFPANDWTLIANDAPSGGANYFAIEDATDTVISFKLMAGAPANAIYVAANGNIGLSTGTPLQAIHTNKNDTPGIRLEQNGSAGWNPQTWDISGNEANFFVRDVTNSSKLPFRIRPGAPTSSLDISTNGNVGIGTFNPIAKLDVQGSIKLLTMGMPTTNIVEGLIFIDSSDHYLKYYNGTQWNKLSANTDEQDLVSATLTGNILEIDIENGASVSVDLSPLIASLEARITAIETALGLKEIPINNNGISQNSPNPFIETTNIPYFIPYNIDNASVVIYDVKGSKIKEIAIDTRGEGNLTISKNDVDTGTYFYTLIMDGKKSESKIMIKVK